MSDSHAMFQRKSILREEAAVQKQWPWVRMVGSKNQNEGPCGRSLE